MNLTKKHIGQLFDNDGSDGSWCYQLVDIKGKKLLFYRMDGTYTIDSNKYSDWKEFKPRNPYPKEWIRYGWSQAKVGNS